METGESWKGQMSRQTQLYGAVNADHHQPRSNFSRKEPEKNLSRQMVMHKILKQIHTTVHQFIHPGLQASFHLSH